MWVYRLQQTLRKLDSALDTVDLSSIDERIQAAESSHDQPDTFTRDRQRATIAHLQQLKAHQKAIELEKTRTTALVEYAMAYLEEARAGLFLGTTYVGEGAPGQLSEVLERLRTYAVEGSARRQTARELTIEL